LGKATSESAVIDGSDHRATRLNRKLYFATAWAIQLSMSVALPTKSSPPLELILLSIQAI